MNWDALIRRAALQFSLAPAEFWRLSLTEWRALTAEPSVPPPLSRTAFEALAATYPDEVRHPGKRVELVRDLGAQPSDVLGPGSPRFALRPG